MTIAEKIKEVRTKAGMSQKKFADALAVSQSRIARYETSKGEPGEELIQKICETFDVTREWLLGIAALEPVKKAAETVKTEEPAAEVPEESAVQEEAEEKTAAEASEENAVQEAAEETAADAAAENAAEEAEAPAAAEEKAADPVIVVQSVMGGEITVGELLNRIAAVVRNAEKIYVKPEENKAYWVKGEASGFIELW
ncbi:MAG: helix-turn-helix transcriptional regulator [Blautia sp.]|nr:helix-turn-helix transcriptional regulator [Blautia sp.]